MKVVDDSGETLGEVEEVLVDRGSKQPKTAIVHTGGLLGIGGKRVAVDVNDLVYEESRDVLVAATFGPKDIEEMEPYREETSGN